MSKGGMFADSGRREVRGGGKRRRQQAMTIEQRLKTKTKTKKKKKRKERKRKRKSKKKKHAYVEQNRGRIWLPFVTKSIKRRFFFVFARSQFTPRGIINDKKDTQSPKCACPSTSLTSSSVPQPGGVGFFFLFLCSFLFFSHTRHAHKKNLRRAEWAPPFIHTPVLSQLPTF